MMTSSILLQSDLIGVTEADSVKLLRIHSDNSTLNHGLPKFYNCIEQAVKHSVNKQKDSYFKTEPTKNEVIKCYYKVLINGTMTKSKRGH